MFFQAKFFVPSVYEINSRAYVAKNIDKLHIGETIYSKIFPNLQEGSILQFN